MPDLTVEGFWRGWIVYLDADEVTVGRSRTNSIVIPDLILSRRHFSIIREGNRFRLRDSGSHNGTFVNGLRVRECLLEEGDSIRAGGSEFVFLLRCKDEVAESSMGPDHLVDRGWAWDSGEESM